jgi:hypothetical protein
VTGVVVLARVIMGLFLGWCVTMVIRLAWSRVPRSGCSARSATGRPEAARAQAEADRLTGAARQRAMPPGPADKSWEL